MKGKTSKQHKEHDTAASFRAFTLDVKYPPEAVTDERSLKINQVVDYVFGTNLKIGAILWRCKQHRLQHVLRAEAGVVSCVTTHPAPRHGALSFSHSLQVANQSKVNVFLKVCTPCGVGTCLASAAGTCLVVLSGLSSWT